MTGLRSAKRICRCLSNAPRKTMSVAIFMAMFMAMPGPSEGPGTAALRQTERY